jgi:excinuclease Cho
LRRRKPYTYPEHLREQVDAAPSAPGVYFFHGDVPELPLYIGKSVNLRSRLLAHLRNRREARLLQQTRSISFERTVGGIGALLLEARLIKQRYPLLNRQLRHNRRLCSIRLQSGIPAPVAAHQMHIEDGSRYFGLFRSEAAVRTHLLKLADEQDLCLAVMRLERAIAGHPCARLQLGRCRGACVGQEPLSAHQSRLMTALSALAIAVWPWQGAVAIAETDGQRDAYHVVQNWCHLGTVDSIEQARTLRRTQPEFDADCYKILCNPLIMGTATIIDLSAM